MTSNDARIREKRVFYDNDRFDVLKMAEKHLILHNLCMIAYTVIVELSNGTFFIIFYSCPSTFFFSQ